MRLFRRKTPLELFDVEVGAYGFTLTPKRRGRAYRMGYWGLVERDGRLVYDAMTGEKGRGWRTAKAAFAAARARVDGVLEKHPYGPKPAVSGVDARWACGTVKAVGRHSLRQWYDAFNRVVPRIRVEGEDAPAGNLTEFLRLDGSELNPKAGLDEDSQSMLLMQFHGILRRETFNALGYPPNEITKSMAEVAFMELAKKLTPEVVGGGGGWVRQWIRPYSMLNFSERDYEAGITRL